MSLRTNGVGRLTEDPHLTHVGDDERAKVSFRLAVDNGQRPATFVNVEAWDKQATAVADHLTKGSRVYIDGRLTQNEWTNNGQRHSTQAIVADSIQFLGEPNINRNAPQAQATRTEPELA